MTLSLDALERLAYRRRYSGKLCPGCLQYLPLTAFGPDLSKDDGLRRLCRGCTATLARAARAKRKDSLHAPLTDPLEAPAEAKGSGPPLQR